MLPLRAESGGAVCVNLPEVGPKKIIYAAHRAW